MKKLILIATSIFLLAFSCMEKETVSDEKTSNMMLLPSSNDPVLNIALWWQLGSVHDPEGKEGLANLTIQMIFGGSTESMKYAEIQKKLDPIASGYYSTCDKELTTFKGYTHPDNLKDFYPLFIEAISKPAFAEDDFNRIKTNLIQSIEKSLRTASDEELAKATLYGEIFEGTPYEHLTTGTVQGLKSITIEDVKKFYQDNFTGENLNIAVSGDYPEWLQDSLNTVSKLLPTGTPAKDIKINPEPINGKEVKLVEKQTIGTSISIGFPIDITRADDDFVALDVFRSWFGEHRNSTSHLYQVIREARGINYGDYAYIEAFLNGGSRRTPSINNPRSQQIFEMWIRTVPHEVRTFSLRAALRELKMVVDNGLTQEEFEMTKNFLNKYVLHYAPTSGDRLGYMIDSKFYGMNTDKSYIEQYRDKLQKLTLEDVNNAIKKHIQYENLVIAAATQGAEEYAKELTSGEPSPITYDTPKPEAVMEEDKEIESFPLGITMENIEIVPVSEMFEK